MIGLTLKKWFYDYWDHFLHFLIINVLYLFSALIPFGISPALVEFSTELSFVVFILGLLWMGIFTSACSLYINEIAQFRRPEMRNVLGYFKRGFAWGLLYSGIWGVVIFLLAVALPFYSSLQSTLGVVAMAFVFWSLIFLLLSIQYYFPIIAQLDTRPLKVLKKMFIILFDNIFFSLFMAFVTIAVLFLSGFTAFLFLGPGGAVLLGHVAFRLRMYKYDFLEENPQSKKIPWKSLTHEDQELVGTRSFRSFIFPWKD